MATWTAPRSSIWARTSGPTRCSRTDLNRRESLLQGKKGTEELFVETLNSSVPFVSLCCTSGKLSKYRGLESSNAPREVSLAILDYGEMHVSEISRNVAFIQIKDGATPMDETCVIQNHDVPRLPRHWTFRLVAYGPHFSKQIIRNGFPVFEGRENSLAIEVASKKQEISKCRFVAEHRLGQRGHKKVSMDYAVNAFKRVRAL